MLNPVTVWMLTTSGSSGDAGSFFGDSSQNGGGGSGNPGSSGAGAGTSAWGLFSGANSDTGAGVQIDHVFTGAPSTLPAIGQTVSINLDNGYVNGGGGSVGMRLFGNGGFNFALSFTGGDAVYRYFDSSGGSGNGLLGYTDGGINVALTLTSLTTYNGTLTGLTSDAGNNISWSGTFSNGGAPTDIEVYTTDNHGGGAYDFFSNNLTVIPEPGTYALVLGGFGMLSVFRRRGIRRE